MSNTINNCPKVSIIVPIYNAEEYLRECLNSIVEQTLSEIEIICVNDGSTDSSIDIIKEYSMKDSRVIVIEKENTGYGHSMNCGLEKARGEYIGVVESDDYVDCDMYEQLYNSAKENDAQIVKSNYWQHRGRDEDTFYEFFSGYKYNEVLRPAEEDYILCRNINLWTGIYQKAFLTENGIRFNETPGASYQDVSFTIKTMVCAQSLILLNRAFYHYRIDNPNSSVKSKGKVYCICDEFGEVWDYLNCRPEIYERVKHAVPFIQFLRYRDTYRRIDESFKREFFFRMIEDFYILDQKNLLVESYWTSFAWAIIHNIMGKHESDTIKYERKYKNQKKHYSNSFISELKNANNIYIYGAGKVGQQVATILNDANIDYSGFLVSDVGRNDAVICNKPVFYYCDIISKHKGITVLVAVKDEDQIYVTRLLEIMGVDKLILLNRDFRLDLREWINYENGSCANKHTWLLEEEMAKLKW